MSDIGLVYCPYIPLSALFHKATMKLKFKDVGEKRWLCRATVPSDTAKEFTAWLQETLEDRVLITRVNTEYDAYGERKATYDMELRGGDINDQTLLALRWGNND